MNNVNPYVERILDQVNAVGGCAKVDVLSFNIKHHTVKFLQGLIEKIQNGTVTVEESTLVCSLDEPNLQKYTFIVKQDRY